MRDLLTFSVNIESMTKKIMRCVLFDFARKNKEKAKRKRLLRADSKTLAKKCMEYPLTRLALRQTPQKLRIVTKFNIG